jgi:hypothetical protein
MPRRATGRAQGRPKMWECLNRRYDPDWPVLFTILQVLDDEGVDFCTLIQVILVARGGDCANQTAVTRIERKFWSLLEHAARYLAAQKIALTDDDLVRRAQDILIECMCWHDVTPDEWRTIHAANKIWGRILLREQEITSVDVK